MTVQGRGQRCPTGMRKVPQPSKESEIEMLGTSFGLDVAVPVDHHSLQHPKDTDTARKREDDDCVRARETQIESMAVVTINNPAFLRDEGALNLRELVSRRLGPTGIPIVLVKVNDRNTCDSP